MARQEVSNAGARLVERQLGRGFCTGADAMTERARLVLMDAEYAWNRLERSDDRTEVRVLWFTAVALLRAVGHVLEKVDGASDSAIAEAVKFSWQKWHEHPLSYPLFHEFIEEERNVLLKEYAHRYEDEPGSLYADGEAIALGDLLFTPLTHGRFAGEDGRDIIREAIDWWSAGLDAIDGRAAAIRIGTG